MLEELSLLLRELSNKYYQLGELYNKLSDIDRQYNIGSFILLGYFPELSGDECILFTFSITRRNWKYEKFIYYPRREVFFTIEDENFSKVGIMVNVFPIIIRLFFRKITVFPDKSGVLVIRVEGKDENGNYVNIDIPFFSVKIMENMEEMKKYEISLPFYSILITKNTSFLSHVLQEYIKYLPEKGKGGELKRICEELISILPLFEEL